MSTVQLAVSCPPDAAPGTLVRVAAPDGSFHDVTVPAGVLPGQSFHVELSPAMPTASTAAASSDGTRDGGGDRCGDGDGADGSGGAGAGAGGGAGGSAGGDLGPELELRDPISDAPGGLQALGAELAGERALVADFFGGSAVEVGGGEVLERALRSVLACIGRLDTLDELIDARAAEFEGWSAADEQRLEWTQTFGEYVALVEAGVAEALDELECSSDELYDYARCYHVESAPARRLLDKLLAMADYRQFCAMMREAHEHGGSMGV